MPESELFLGLAQIAGIFVGFAALISATREEEPSDSTAIQIVVESGLMVIAAALVPIAIDRYGMNAEMVWRPSSVFFLGMIWVGWVFTYLNSATNQRLAESVSGTSKLTIAVWLTLELAIEVPLVLVILGFAPHLLAALYSTALIAAVLQASVELAQLVLRPPDLG